MFLLALATGRLVVLDLRRDAVSFTLLLNPRMAAGGFIVALLHGRRRQHDRYRVLLGAGARRFAAGFVAAANILTVALLTADIYLFLGSAGSAENNSPPPSRARSASR